MSLLECFRKLYRGGIAYLESHCELLSKYPSWTCSKILCLLVVSDIMKVMIGRLTRPATTAIDLFRYISSNTYYSKVSHFNINIVRFGHGKVKQSQLYMEGTE